MNIECTETENNPIDPPTTTLVAKINALMNDHKIIKRKDGSYYGVILKEGKGIYEKSKDNKYAYLVHNRSSIIDYIEKELEKTPDLKYTLLNSTVERLHSEEVFEAFLSRSRASSTLSKIRVKNVDGNREVHAEVKISKGSDIDTMMSASIISPSLLIDFREKDKTFTVDRIQSILGFYLSIRHIT